MLMITVLLPLVASAHFMGGRWPWTNGHHLLNLNYDSNCSSWQTRSDAAAWSWSVTSTPLWFTKVATDCSAHASQVDIFNGYNSNPSILAWTQNYDRVCFFLSCWWDPNWTTTYASSIIHLNFAPDSFGWLSAFDGQAVVVHELGHSLGLAHAGYYAGESTGAYSIMDYCCYGYNTPQPHDVNDINHLYPGW
jgi:hypothetical protein